MEVSRETKGKGTGCMMHVLSAFQSGLSTHAVAAYYRSTLFDRLSDLASFPNPFTVNLL